MLPLSNKKTSQNIRPLEYFIRLIIGESKSVLDKQFIQSYANYQSNDRSFIGLKNFENLFGKSLGIPQPQNGQTQNRPEYIEHKYYREMFDKFMNSEISILFIFGIGGCGKTRFIYEQAHRYLNNINSGNFIPLFYNKYHYNKEINLPDITRLLQIKHS